MVQKQMSTRSELGAATLCLQVSCSIGLATQAVDTENRKIVLWYMYIIHFQPRCIIDYTADSRSPESFGLSVRDNNVSFVRHISQALQSERE